MILELIDKATANGARLQKAAASIGLSVRTLIRWRSQNAGEDQRHGPQHAPANKLSQEERKNILAVATSPAFRDLSPKQIVPTLADQGRYIGSESSFYRVLKEHQLLTHRQACHNTATAGARGHWALPGVELRYYVLAHIGSGNLLLPVPVSRCLEPENRCRSGLQRRVHGA